MKRTSMWIAIALAAATMPASNADPNTDAFKAVSAAYVKFDAAAAARSVSGTLAIDTNGYVVLDSQGKVLYKNGAKMVEMYRKTYGGAAQVKQTTSLQKLSLKNGVWKAVVLQRLQLSAIDPNINNWRTWVIDWKMEDTWASYAGVWKRNRTVMLNQSSSKRVGPVQ